MPAELKILFDVAWYRLRKLEMSFLQSGVAVCRTADDLTRHHGKMMIVDGELYVIGFNFTELDINRSRSFGIVTREPSLVKAASALFQADSTRQPYDATHKHLVISPETTRKLLTDFIKGAKKELLIYDEKVSDKAMVKLLRDHSAGKRVVWLRSQRDVEKFLLELRR